MVLTWMILEYREDDRFRPIAAGQCIAMPQRGQPVLTVRSSS
jgi:hypothetical protein